MTTHTTTTATRDHLRRFALDALQMSGLSAADLGNATLDTDLMLAAIEAGTAPSDSNEGMISDPLERMAFGCVMNNGPWWVA